MAANDKPLTKATIRWSWQRPDQTRGRARKLQLRSISTTSANQQNHPPPDRRSQSLFINRWVANGDM